MRTCCPDSQSIVNGSCGPAYIIAAVALIALVGGVPIQDHRVAVQGVGDVAH